MTRFSPPTSDMIGGRRQTFRAPVARFVGLWSFGILAVSGAVAIALFAMLRPGLIVASDLRWAAGIWFVLSVVASASLAGVLSAILAAPANTLLALKRIDGDASPVDRHALSRSYRDLDELLVRTAHERTGRLNELARSRDSARVEGEAMAAFFAGMSHELRTPLNAIMGYAMLLAEDAGEAGKDTQVRDLDRILQSSRHLLRLINDILDLTRLDAGEVVIDRSVVDVSATVRTVVASLEDEASRSGVRVSAHVAPDARVMLGDAARLRQCLTTIVSNLLETHQDPSLPIDARLAEGAVARVEFRIPDGAGVVAAAVASALEVEQEHMRGAPSVPLGSVVLAMTVVRRIAVLMGGSLRTERAESGDVVILALPANSVASHVPTGPAAALPVSASTRPDRGRKTVLVIDDDEPSVDLLDRWLTGQGYRVIAATSGPAGLELARAHSPDFIVLDIIMPGQSGYEVLAQVKADPRLRNIPVIIVSSDDNRRLGLESGAAEVLVKPLSRRGLSRVLDVLGEQVIGDLLVVDDDKDVREIVQRFALQAGLTVRLAANGHEGMAMARASAPGAIVLDLCMPDSDGFAMMDDLARDPSLSHVPVMVLSQLNISVAQHARIREAGHVFHPKWNSSPSQIVENIKSMVAR
ncbi:MAG: response regulator [Hyphomicrobium sp.]